MELKLELICDRYALLSIFFMFLSTFHDKAILIIFYHINLYQYKQQSIYQKTHHKKKYQKQSQFKTPHPTPNLKPLLENNFPNAAINLFIVNIEISLWTTHQKRSRQFVSGDLPNVRIPHHLYFMIISQHRPKSTLSTHGPTYQIAEISEYT